MDSRVVAHATLMATTIGVVVPAGVALALRESPRHKYVQACGLALLLVGVSLALAAAGAPHADSKRHADSPTHEHAEAHSVAGIVVVTLYTLAAGVALVGVRVDEIRPTTRALHRLLAVLIAVGFVFQLTSGVAALLELPRRSGVDQTIGHLAPAVALCGAGSAALYRRRLDEKALAPLLVEAALVCVAGALATLYSLYSEWPYAGSGAHWQHLVASLTLLVGGGGELALLLRRVPAVQSPLRRRALASSVFGALVLAVTMFAHPQHSAYASAFHRSFASALLCVAVARALSAWRSLAASLYVSAALFAAAQRGCATLYDERYADALSVVDAIVIVSVVGVSLFAYAFVLDRLFDVQKSLSRRMSELIDED